MDWSYIGGLILSILLFAPGLIILTMALVVGFLMLLEKIGLFSTARRTMERMERAAQGFPTAADLPPVSFMSELESLPEADPDTGEREREWSVS